jgi:putative spermidine/putrescine transport system ATP-binding protein
VQGTVTFVRDLGPVRDIHLDTPLGKLVAEYGADHSRILKVGEVVDLTLPPEALRIYPRVPGAAALDAVAAE